MSYSGRWSIAVGVSGQPLYPNNSNDLAMIAKPQWLLAYRLLGTQRNATDGGQTTIAPPPLHLRKRVRLPIWSAASFA
jgi:hypothetical protein